MVVSLMVWSLKSPAAILAEKRKTPAESGRLLGSLAGWLLRRVVRVSHFCPNLIYGTEVFPQPADRLFTEVMS